VGRLAVALTRAIHFERKKSEKRTGVQSVGAAKTFGWPQTPRTRLEFNSRVQLLTMAVVY
jgi:hypothetical protein